jgi:hypothetical protein
VTISPYEEAHFLREGVVDINAAVVGISKARWTCIEASDTTKEQAAAIMCQQRFDVLPIVNGTEIKQYFRTQKWGDYSSISQETITHRDVIPFHMHIRDVIKGFALESRNFYFLHNERRIVGLISVVNLNCRQVKVYLFSLLSELEVRLGNFIAAHISEDELLQMTFGEKEKEKHEDVKKRYQEDKTTGVDACFVEYLYLSDLINIIIKQKLYERLRYSRTRFEKSLGSLNDLRHAVAHPARSIITDKHPVEKLWERIDRVEEALFLLG